MALINSTEAAILAALVQGEKYGLAIIDHVKTASDGKLKLTLGGIYPTLYRMQEKGLLKSRWGDEHEAKGGARRRYYGATSLGRRSLSDVIQAISVGAQ